MGKHKEERSIGRDKSEALFDSPSLNGPGQKGLVPYDTPDQVADNFRRWWAAMEVSHAMLMAGLRDKVGPDGDVHEAYRQCQMDHRVQKIRAYERAAERYQQWQKKNLHTDEQSDAT
jgi:hypothetical protein